jgi:uncharacterized membrane protein
MIGNYPDSRIGNEGNQGKMLKKFSGVIRTHANGILIVISYTVMVGALSVYRYYTGQANAWDLGIFEQALYSFAFHGRLFYYTPEIFTINPSGIFFGIHFSLLMFPLGVFYRLMPYPQTLLFLQSFVTALTIVPLRKICQFAGYKHENLISILYLLNPLTVFSNLFDFHLEAFIPVFLAFLVLSLLNEDTLRTILFSVCTYAVYEYGAIMVLAAILFVVLVRLRTYLRKMKELLLAGADPQSKFIIAIVALTISSVLYFVICLRIMSYFDPALPPITGQFVTSSFRENPLAGIYYAAVLKAEYVFIPIVCLAFLPLFKIRALVLSAPFWVLAIISNYNSYYEIGVQYGYLIIPGLMTASILGLVSISNRMKFEKLFRIIALTFSILAVCSILAVGTYTTAYSGLGPGATIEFGRPYSLAEYQLASMIPRNSSVLAWSGAFPYVANNLDAYSVPTAFQGSPLNQYIAMNKTLELKPEFLLLNSWTGFLPFFNNFSAFIQENYKVYAENGGNVLLKWHYTGLPVLFEGYKINFPSTSFSPQHSARDIYYWHGPWTTLIPGNYVASITYKSNSSGIIDFLITTHGGTMVLYSQMEDVFSTMDGNPKILTISFGSTGVWDNVEFLPLKVSNLNMSVLSITLAEVSI